MEPSTPRKKHNPISLIRECIVQKIKLNLTKQINTTHANTTTSQRKREEEKSHIVINRHAWMVLSITAASPNNVTWQYRRNNCWLNRKILDNVVHNIVYINKTNFY